MPPSPPRSDPWTTLRQKLGYAWYRLRWANPRALRRLARRRPLRIVIGANGVFQHSWIPTDAHYLNLLRPDDWERYFTPGTIDAILAEHVWEHLEVDEAAAAARTCHRYLRDGGHLRVAVPDGNHPDPAYLAQVRPGGSGPGADDHRELYTWRSFGRLFEEAGFEVRLLEYFDDHGEFHGSDWDPADGMVHRSVRFDPRNLEGHVAYTSIVLDAVKRG